MSSTIAGIQFLHIPKAAGTSLASLIETAFEPHEILPVYEWHDLHGWDRSEINRYRCLHGHFGTGLDRLLKQPLPSVCVLRDPFEQMVSHLLHAARHFDPPYEDPKPRRDWLGRMHQDPHPYLALILPRPHNRFRDFQTRFLGVDIDPDNPERKGWSLTEWLYAPEVDRNMDQVLENAKRRLDSIDLIGTVDDLGGLIDRLCPFLGIDRPAEELRLNQGKPDRGATLYRGGGLMSPKLEEMVEKHTSYDRKLVEYAKKSLENRQNAPQRDAA